MHHKKYGKEGGESFGMLIIKKIHPSCLKQSKTL
jgi:hypothetical protein